MKRSITVIVSIIMALTQMSNAKYAGAPFDVQKYTQKHSILVQGQLHLPQDRKLLGVQPFFSSPFSVELLPAPATLSELETHVAAMQSTVQTPPSSKAIELAKKAFEYMNAFRAENNLPALQWNQEIADQAGLHSKKMADIKVLSHDGFQNRSEQLRLKYPRLSGMAENVAQTYEQPDIAQSVITMWKNSPGHRANMLGKYQYGALSFYVADNGNWYATAIFANF